MIVSVSSAYELKKKKHEIPLKIKMFYTFCLTRISGQVFFFTACSISGLEGKARKYIVIQSFGYTAVRASKSTTIGVVNKRDWGKKKERKKEAFVAFCKATALQGNSSLLRLRKSLCSPWVYHPFNTSQAVTYSHFFYKPVIYLSYSRVL